MLNLSLYAILDPEHLGGHEMLNLAQDLQKGGATIVQLRAKKLSTRKMVELARALKSILTVPLLINDRVDVALASKADGVHLGQEDMHVEDARIILGEKAIIGLTLKSANHIQEAPINALNYGALGGVFSTASKDNPNPPLGLQGLKALANQWRAHTSLPLCAIAGITPENAASVIKAGVEGVAVISALSYPKDPYHAAQTFSKIIEKAKSL